MSTMNPNNEAAIFGRLLNAEEKKLQPDVAQYILNIRFAEEDRDRINELAAKARAGILDPDEQRELGNFNLVGDLLAVWQSHARRSLGQARFNSTHE